VQQQRLSEAIALDPVPPTALALPPLKTLTSIKSSRKSGTKCGKVRHNNGFMQKSHITDLGLYANLHTSLQITQAQWVDPSFLDQ
jgi:hypothetical protein